MPPQYTEWYKLHRHHILPDSWKDSLPYDVKANPSTYLQHSVNGQALWLLLSTWPTEMCAVAPTSSTYASDANLWLFDIACNVIANSESGAYRSVCGESHLNPANVEANVAIFFDQFLSVAGKSTPMVLGMQEYPRANTHKGDVYAAALESRKLQAVTNDTGGVAIVYSIDLGEPTVLDCSSIAPAIMITCLENAVEQKCCASRLVSSHVASRMPILCV